MEAEKQAQLAETLYRITMNDNLTWRETSRENALQTTIGKYIIQLERRGREPQEQNEAEYDFVIKVINKSGDVIDEFDDPTIYAQSEYQTMYRDYKTLWTKVKRRLSGADEALDEILKELDKKDEIPF